MTTDVQRVDLPNGYSYYDSPGLDDAENRERAAERVCQNPNCQQTLCVATALSQDCVCLTLMCLQISEMLSDSTKGAMMLCFVITLEQGRIRPSDRLTMELVFKALNQVSTI